jgi:RNA recognition motif-containing protein
VTNGTTVYKHVSGEISTVRLEIAGMGTRRVRIGNLPLEVTDGTIRSALSQYGEIQSMQDETWSKTYSYVVANGIKVVVMALTKHPIT